MMVELDMEENHTVFIDNANWTYSSVDVGYINNVIYSNIKRHMTSDVRLNCEFDLNIGGVAIQRALS